MISSNRSCRGEPVPPVRLFGFSANSTSGLSAWVFASPSFERRSVTRRKATQSSSLYVSICCFSFRDCVLSHEYLQQRHCKPEAFSEVHVAPTNLPTSLSALERTGKYTRP